MDGIIITDKNRIIWKYDDETVWLEAHGENGIRVRFTKEAQMPKHDWSLLPQNQTDCQIYECSNFASIKNGKITAVINSFGRIRFEKTDGSVFLSEIWQDRKDDEHRMSLMTSGRILKPINGGKYEAVLTLRSDPNEKIFGMGQYQMENWDLKGCDLELAQRNSQVSIPFFQSSKGYGFLWNNPAIGRAVFAKNHTIFESRETTLIDYWVTVGDSPKEINRQFTACVGRASKFPEWALGLWQSKLRYETQEQLMQVARAYHDRMIPISVIVCDFFHWPTQGDWCFDEKYWPDPQAMVNELRSMGIELMVSIWPTVDPRSNNYALMKKNGYLVRTEKGVRTQMVCLGAEVFYDATNPEAQRFLFEVVKQNYLKYGIKLFWLDVAEPEYSTYDFENYRYYNGPCLETGNVYPKCYAKGFYDGLKSEGIEAPISLVRSAWVGSQRYGVILWSGDISSRFETLRNQFSAGLNVSLCGIPWWTTDIGGFYGGDPNSKSFRELLVRWFQFGSFCPVFRLHGWRLPTGEGDEKIDTGLFDFDTCGDNEIWSYGDDVYDILKKLIFVREQIKPYIIRQFDLASEDGTPIMRPLFYDFPKDKNAWTAPYQFMFGPDLLVAPILFEGVKEREIYLPENCDWVNISTHVIFRGGVNVQVECPIEVIPLFARHGSVIETLMISGDYVNGYNNY